jgi:large subunit ribosomal protein L3
MILGLLGRKVGMTQIFDPTGAVVPVTVIQAGPCHVLQLRTQDRDGYEAVQVGFSDKPRRLASRAARGHVAKLDSKRQKRRAAAGVEAPAKAACEPKRYIREFRIPVASYEVGQEVKVDILSEVKAVDISGVTKGRGFQGVMKRHGYSGQRASHGVKKCHRHAGTTGQNTSPGRVIKGRRMAGQMGNVNRTVRNLQLVKIDVENNLILVRGAVPGPNGGLLVVRQTNKM